MYLERLSVSGIESSQYYVPNGKLNTAAAGTDIQMPNCTMYCFCRGYESVNATTRFPWVRAQGGFGNAKTWYDTTTLAKGSKLKDGSVAVFDGNCGHVAFVERVIDDTHAVITQSQYNSNKSLRDYHYWQRVDNQELVVGKSTMSGVGPLIGFIYMPISDIRVTRDKTKNQLSVTESFINVRQGPGTSYEINNQGCYCPLGIYDVLDIQEADGYVWYKLEDGYWIANVSGVTYLEASNIERFGIDISEWQEGFDLTAAKDAGVEFAILRAGFTGWGDGVSKKRDKCFEDFYAAGKSLNIPLGAYWYSCATTYENGQAEAEFMIENCLKGKQFELPIFIDVEDTHHQQPAGKEAVSSAIKGFCDYLVEHKYYPGVYASYNWFKNYIDTDKDRWVAFWGASATKPEGCKLWQFTSSDEIAGMKIDQNYLYFDYDPVIKAKGLNGFDGEDEDMIKPVDKDLTKDQIFVNVGEGYYLNMRDEPSTSSAVTGRCENNVYYNVLGSVVKPDYTWYTLGRDAWVADIDGVEYYQAEMPVVEMPYPVERDLTRSQLLINSEDAEAHTLPSLTSPIIGQYLIGYYNIEEVVDSEGRWYRLGDTWVADSIVYIPVEDEPTPEPEPTPGPEPSDEWVPPVEVDPDINKDQIYINTEKYAVRIREDSTTESEVMGYCEHLSYYDVLEVVKKEDFDWYKIGDRSFVAGTDVVDYLKAFVAPVPVEADETKDQLYIGDVVMNIRADHTTTSQNVGTCIKDSNYNVLEVSDQPDYTWYKISERAWVADADEEVIYYPAGTSRKGQELKKLLPALKNEIDIALQCVEAGVGNEFYDELYDKAQDLNNFISDNFNDLVFDLIDTHNYDDINLIYTSDIHGYWKGYEDSTRVVTNFSMNDLNTLKERLLAQNIKPLIVNCGDIIHGSEKANADHGDVAIQEFNDLDFFASVFGNHEFRYNDDGPIFQEQMGKLDSAIACNIVYKKTGDYVFEPYKTAKIGDKTIGIIGVGFPGDDGGRGHLEEFNILTDEACYEKVQQCIDELRAKGIEYIICLAHLGKTSDPRCGGNITIKTIIENTSGLDIMLPGHSHSKGGAEFVKDKSGKKVFIADQPRCDMAYISIVKLSDGDFSSELIDHM